MSIQVADARATLADVVGNELPLLEHAIHARDFDLALTYGAVVRSARQRVRSLLGGGDTAGLLRAEWAKVEARLDLALVSAPRPSPDRDLARRQWAQRLARGTGTHAQRIDPPRAAGRRKEVFFTPQDSDTLDTIDEELPPEPPTVSGKRPKL
jgi:hypothetical protein